MEEETEYVNGIEVLAGLCDEHGLNHWDSEAMACDTHIFVDRAGNPHECWEAPSGMVNVVISMTPEQAAMLGTETCHMEYDADHSNDELYPTEAYECSACGCVTVDGKPNFCPNCGRKVVDE